MHRVGVDIGGTFTDLLMVSEDGRAVIGKTLTTPGDPSLAVETALSHALHDGAVEPQEVAALVHGTTLVTDRKSTRLNSSRLVISYAVFCLKKKTRTATSRSTNAS